jgi:hypothetical protein
VGAAALGLCGVGLADDVTSAAAQLTGALPLRPVEVDAGVRAGLEDARARVRPLLDSLGAVAGLLEAEPLSGCARTPAADRAA